MDRPITLGADRFSSGGFACRFSLVACLATCLVGASLLATGCTQNQVKSLLGLKNEADAPPPEIIAAPAAPAVPAPSPAPVRPEPPASAIDVNPGSGRDVKLTAGFLIKPPATFNVISEQEGSDFRSNYVHYRWERVSGGAWFIVSFLSGLDYEGDRAPKIQDERVVARRIQAAFARVDKKHQLRSLGSRTEKLAGLSAIRTNVAGKVEGEDAVGHLYLLSDDKHLIEIVALATESNRSVLKVCRETVATLSRGPAKNR